MEREEKRLLLNRHLGAVQDGPVADLMFEGEQMLVAFLRGEHQAKRQYAVVLTDKRIVFANFTWPEFDPVSQESFPWKSVQHWSADCGSDRTLTIFLPDIKLELALRSDSSPLSILDLEKLVAAHAASC